MACGHQFIWGLPKIRGTFLGVPIARIIIFWGLCWGSLVWGNYHFIFSDLRILRAQAMTDPNDFVASGLGGLLGCC